MSLIPSRGIVDGVRGGFLEEFASGVMNWWSIAIGPDLRP
jgi:hypothetical protein